MRRLLDTWIDQPFSDLAIAAACGLLVWRLDLSLGAPAGEVLQAFAALAVAAAGFGTLTTSVMASVNQPDRLRVALEAVGHRLVALMVWSILALWIAAGLFSSAIAVPSDSAIQASLLALGVVISAGATSRSTYLLLLVLKALMPEAPPTPRRDGTPIVLDGPDPSGYEIGRTSAVKITGAEVATSPDSPSTEAGSP